MKKYYIHNNGGRPYMVHVDKDVEVYENTYENDDDKYKLLKTYVPINVFIGKKSPAIRNGSYDGTYGIGNSILLQLTKNTYLYIGHEIIKFNVPNGDVIESYYSDIGNSDVPYPYAVGEKYIYIMLDMVCIPVSFFDMKKDIYLQYYEVNTFSKHKLSPAVFKKQLAEFMKKVTKLNNKLIHRI
jgi:hypothetical protein